MGLIDSIINAESGGDPNAKNPNSSATGLGQFISSTWLDTIKAARPDIAQGKSDQELLALRTDPQLSRELTQYYADQNGAILSKAGVPVTPGSTYLAHFAGPQGAIKLLKADPSVPVSSILDPAAVRANPFLQGMSVGQLQAWADRKVGSVVNQPSQNNAPVSPATNPGSPQLLPGAQQSGPPLLSNFRSALLAAQQPPESSSSQISVEQMQAPPPIFGVPKRQIDINKLRMARFGGPFSFRG